MSKATPDVKILTFMRAKSEISYKTRTRGSHVDTFLEFRALFLPLVMKLEIREIEQ